MHKKPEDKFRGLTSSIVSRERYLRDKYDSEREKNVIPTRDIIFLELTLYLMIEKGDQIFC